MLFYPFLVCLLVCFSHAQRELEVYNIDPDLMSVSGLSSGGCIATQFHVAYSSWMYGAGIMAAVPYYCGEANEARSIRCMTDADSIEIDRLANFTYQFETDDEIDSSWNLRDDNVFVLTGALDAPDVGRKVEDYYQRFVSEGLVKANFDLQADHCFPTEDEGRPCDTKGDQCFLCSCNYSAAFDTLNTIYDGNLQEPEGDETLDGDLYIFDQREFFEDSQPSDWSMDDEGYVYVPTGCMDRSEPCKLHIVYHGCNQGKAYVDDCLVTRAGYSEVGELNDIILLYPQAIRSVVNPVNPQGCWDWWGYNDRIGQPGTYAKRDGEQMLATYKMMLKIAGLSR